MASNAILAPRSYPASGRRQQQNSMIPRLVGLRHHGPSMFDSASDVRVYGGTFTSQHTPQTSVTVNINHGPTDESTANNDHRNENQNRLGTPPQIRPRLSRASADPPYQLQSRPVRRSNVLYEEHLMDKGRGHPIWIPQSNLRLPIPYRAKGVSIGDVGFITPDGAFDFLFNICLLVEDPIHCEDLPDSFTALRPPLRRTDVREFREFTDGSYLASAFVEKVQSNHQESRTLAFESSASEGAILTMPEGAYMEDLNNISKFRDYISVHAKNWYKFVNGPCGREAKNGDLRVVVGCDKATSWGMAIFSDIFRRTNIRLEFNARYDGNGHVLPGNVYNWNHSGTAEVRTGPGAGENDPLVNDPTLHPLRNQCLFVRTLSVTLSDVVWEQLYPKTPVEIKLKKEKEASSPTSELQTPRTSFIAKSKFSNAPSSGVPQEENIQQPIDVLFTKEQSKVNSAVIITPSSVAPATIHPSKVLNEFLLKEVPEATMSIVNDRDWYISSTSMEANSDETTLISRILAVNNVVSKNGAAYFEPKNPDNPEPHLTSQIHQLIDGNISVEQYLFGGQGGTIEDMFKRRRVFLDNLQHELLQDFLIDGVDLSDCFAAQREAFPDTLRFLEDIQEKARSGRSKVTLKHPRGTDPISFAGLRGHPHRLLSLCEVIHLAGLKLSTSQSPVPTAGPGTETIEALRSWLDHPTEWFAKIRNFCMLRLGEALHRRFLQFRQREDLDEAIFYYKDALTSTPSSILHLEASLGLCEFRYHRLLLLGDFDDLVELVRGFNAQTSNDFSTLLIPIIDQLRDPPKTDLPFFDSDQKFSTSLPLESEPATTSLAMLNQSVNSIAIAGPSIGEPASIRREIRESKDNYSQFTDKQFLDTDGLSFSDTATQFTDGYSEWMGSDSETVTDYMDDDAEFMDLDSGKKDVDDIHYGANGKEGLSMLSQVKATDALHNQHLTKIRGPFENLRYAGTNLSSMSTNVQVLSNAQNANIRDTIFNTHVGDQHNYYGSYHEGLTKLSQAIATDALHVSGSTSGCHPGTRQKLIGYIHSWIKEADETRKDILWIHGPPGSGKSTIMQSIAELCFSCELEKRHPGGIFFARRNTQRKHDECLYSTLSYSLIQCIPALQDSINHIMVLDPTIPTQKPDLQLRKLVFEPLIQHGFPPTETPFVIIDGLDECKGHHTQKRILDSIVMALKTYGRFVRFIITARSEAHIRDIFDSPEFKCRTQVLPLDNLFEPKNDIRLYLEDSFEEITRLNKSYLKAPWYRPSDIDYLVEKSSGQFLYAATVVRFVGTELTHPAKQLEIVLKPSKASSLYPNIDDLYTQILETIPDKENLLRIFGLLLTLHCPQPPKVYDDILGLQEAGGTTFILRGLHSIIRYPHPSDFQNERRELERRLEYDKTRGLRFYHASFQDFLVDRERSKHFFVDLYDVPADLVKSGFKFMTKWISCPWRRRTGDEIRPNRETWGYLKHHMGTHLAECRSNDHASVPVVEDLLDFQARLSFPPPTPIENAIWDHSFDALHSMVTACALILNDEGKQQNRIPTNFHSEHSHWAQDCSLDPSKVTPKQSDRFGEVYIKYCALLDKLYQFALSSSSDVLDILDKLPGLVTDPSPIVYNWLHSLFRIDRDDITATMEQNGKFFHRWNNAFWNQHFNLEGDDHLDDVVLLLNPHFARFLCDQRRAGKFYRDPELQIILDYSHIISMIFSPDWLEVQRSRNEVTHLDVILRRCLESIGLSHLSSPPDGHPIIQLADVLKALFYDLPCLQTAPVVNVDLVWSATRRLLEWLQRQHEKSREKDPAITGSHRIRKTLAQISVQIYNQILQIHPLDNGGRLVAISDPFLVAISRDFESETPPVLVPPPTPALPGQLVLSETLLSLNGIRSSLLAFFSKPERSKQMHIPPEVYHTQFAEICLQHCDPSVSEITRDWRSLASHKDWRFHLVRATPSDYILNKLGEIPFGPWLAEGQNTGDSQKKKKAIVAIIKWLKKVSENRPEIIERWRQILEDLRRLERWERSRRALPGLPNPPNSSNFSEGSMFVD